MWLIAMMVACGLSGADEAAERGGKKKGKRARSEAPATADVVSYGEMVDGYCSMCNTGQMPTIQAKASSMLKEGGQTYSASFVLDENPATAWCEGSDGDGVGETLTLSFSKPVSVQALEVQGGYFKSGALLRDNGRIKRVKVAIDGNRSTEVSFSDPSKPGSVSRSSGISWLEQITQNPAVVMLGFPEDATTTSLELTVLETFKGAKHTDTCISGVGVQLVDPAWFN